MATNESVIANPESGRLIGTRGDDTVLRFPGVRYGTAKRFARPTRPGRHAEPIDATRPGPICPQLPSRLESVMGRPRNEPPQSEDCLYLAIATPSLTGRRPVMVWLHGGAFVSGGGTLAWSDGGRLAADGDVVVVSVNYRLGALGYLVHEGVSDGNLGLYDQMLALEWVRDNIEAFGGDPGNITVFGQSAGAFSTLALLSIPRSRALIRRAIVQSSPGWSVVQERSEAAKVGEYFASVVEGDLATAATEQLLAAQTLTAQWTAANSPPSVTPAGPVLAEPFEHTQAHQDVLLSDPVPDLLIGYTTEEALAFAVGAPDAEARRALAELSRNLIVEPSRKIGRQCTEAGGAVFSYEFAWEPETGSLGAVHCLELPFLLGTPESWSGSPMLGDTSWDTVEVLGKRLRRCWTNFAWNGSPGSAEAQWPRWSEERMPDYRIEPSDTRTTVAARSETTE